MIDLYYWTTPNGHKITMFLEETGLEYRVIPINIGKGEQFREDFLKISPNNKIPAIVDHAPSDGGEPVTVFESGAILQYLAEKTGSHFGETPRERFEVLEWLMWQMGGLGPMAGQAHHFMIYAPEKVPYAIKRYGNEVQRLYAVFNKRLKGREYVAGSYSIADMAIYPWVVSHERQGVDLANFPEIKRWFDSISARPAVKRAYALKDKINPDTSGGFSQEEKDILFGQDAKVVR